MKYLIRPKPGMSILSLPKQIPSPLVYQQRQRYVHMWKPIDNKYQVQRTASRGNTGGGMQSQSLDFPGSPLCRNFSYLVSAKSTYWPKFWTSELGKLMGVDIFSYCVLTRSGQETMVQFTSYCELFEFCLLLKPLQASTRCLY